MRKIILVFVAIGIASCGSVNHLNHYSLRKSSFSFSTGIDPISDPVIGTTPAGDDNSNPFVWLADIAIDLFTPKEDPMMHEASIADYFEDGFRNELDSTLTITYEEAPDLAEYNVAIQISDCELVPTDTCCNVKFNEELNIRSNLENAEVLHEARTIEVPLRYCGSVMDSVSVQDAPLTKYEYQKLTGEEQLSALQCDAVQAGIQLADTLIQQSKELKNRSLTRM